MSIPREERLLNLVALLLTRSATFEEIQELIEGYPPEHASARRQFERDKDLLRESGIALEIDSPGDAGGEYRYEIVQPRLADLDLTREERTALQLALVSANVGRSLANRALNKLGGREFDDVTSSARFEFVDAYEASEAATFWEAIAKSSVVTFTYRSDVRSLEPWGLAFRYGNLYVIGFDCDKKEPRTFRLDRVRDGVVIQHARTASAPRPSPLAPLFDSIVETPTVATLSVDEVGAALLGAAGQQGAATGEAEWRTVHHPFVDEIACRNYLAMACDHAVILEPLDWRERFLRHIKAIA